MARFRVAVVELDAQRKVHETVVVADDESDAKAIGLAKLFGKSAFWFADSGLPGGHWGQVFRPLRGDGNQNTSLTPRARLDVEPA